MKSKIIPLSFARCLKRMLEGERLNASEIASTKILKYFVEDGVIQKLPTGSRRVRFVCNKPENLQYYLKNKYDVIALDEYIRLSELKVVDGQDSLKATNSTKVFRTKSLQGFFIKVFDTQAILSGSNLPTLPDGAMLFIHQATTLKIPHSTLIVGVENPECFEKIESLLDYFPNKELLIVMRYLSSSPASWLQTVPNQYLHFGDFDPAGISIYFNEYLNRLGSNRCTFFVPKNVETLVEQYGSRDLFDRQSFLLDNFPLDCEPKLSNLITFLKKQGKGLEQERLLNTPSNG